MQFPVQPEPGRFHLLRGPIPELPFVHLRLTTDNIIEALLGATAYRSATPPQISGLNHELAPALLATLLTLPTTTARVLKQEPGAVTTHLLELSCWDNAGIELRARIGLSPSDAHALVNDALSSLIAAVGALDAVIASVEAERGGSAGDDQTVLRDARVKGADVQVHPAYRRAVARGVGRAGTRAYHLAHQAETLGRQLDAATARRDMLEKKAREAKRERRRSAIERRAKGKMVAKREIDFFDDVKHKGKEEKAMEGGDDEVEKEAADAGGEAVEKAGAEAGGEAAGGDKMEESPARTQIENGSQEIRKSTKRRKKRRLM